MLDFALTLVSSDRDTLEGVHEYLTRFGARLSSTSRLDRVSEEAEASTADAVVLFADDYPRDHVLRTVRELSSRLVVIITGHGAEFEEALDPSPTVLVLPRPIWGWVLIDALRVGVGMTSERPGAT